MYRRCRKIPKKKEEYPSLTIGWIGDIDIDAWRPTSSNSNNNTPPPPPPPPPPPQDPLCPTSTWAVQFTPELSLINGPNLIGGAEGMRIAIAQANDGAGSNGLPNWIPQSSWDAAYWDGVPFNYCGKTTAEMMAWIWPSKYTMRGLRQLYEAKRPFANESFPTIREIDMWNVEVIRLYRALLGLTNDVQPSRCLFLRANWSDEKKFTSNWDTVEPSYTCDPNATASHCGAAFAPPADLQVPYQLPGDVYCPYLNGGAEDIFPAAVYTNIPWSIKMSVVVRSASAEGFTGHGGPFVGRCLVGISFVVDLTPSKSTTHVRLKWMGYLAPSPTCPLGTTTYPPGVVLA